MFIRQIKSNFTKKDKNNEPPTLCHQENKNRNSMKYQTISNKMRQILLTFFCLILLSSKTFSQQNLQLTRLNNSCDTLVVKTLVWFPFGSQSACPQLSYFETVGNSDTMELKLFYDVRGA